MATQMDRNELDLQEQLVRIRQMGANTDKAIAELQRTRLDTDKVLVDIEKTRLDTDKTRVDIEKVLRETRVMTWVTIFQAMLATAALLGAGAAIAKLFFP